MVEEITLYKNNEMNIKLTKNTKCQRRTTHIDIQPHYIWKLVDKRELTIK